MKNGEFFNSLTAEEQKFFREVYGNHPLKKYIDWKEYYESENGNTLDFVKSLKRYKNEQGKTVFVLEEIAEDDNDFLLIFVCEDNEFHKIPKE